MSATLEKVGEVFVSALVSGTITGVGFKYLTRYIDHKMEQKEEEEQRAKKQRHDQYVAEAKLRHASGRLFFWIVHAIQKPPANGELEKAFQDYTAAEEEQKALDRETLATVYEEGQK